MSTEASELERLLNTEAPKKEDITPKVITEKEMVQLTAQPPALSTLVSDTDSLKNIVATQKQLSQVKESLGSIIDTMAQNPSIFTRASTYFGEMHMWKKITLGLGLSVPTLAAGIFAHVGALLVISGVTVVAYTATGIVLDDHHHCNISIAARLKAGIFNLADVLQLTIDALETIRKKLAEEIEKFKSENIKLAKHVVDLGDQIGTLGTQIECYVETEKMLRSTKDSLEETAVQLKKSTSDQAELIKKNQEELVAVTAAYSKSQEQLSDKIIELTTVKVEMGCEVEKAKNIASVLSGAVSTLSGTVVEDEVQRKAFQAKLDSFLTDKKASFDKVADRIFDAEKELLTVKDELRNVKDELTRSLKSQEVLLDRQEKHIARLEAIPSKTIAVVVKPKDEAARGKENVASLLNRSGIYAPKHVPDVPTDKKGLPVKVESARALIN